MTTIEDEKKRKRGADLERAATLFTAAIASAVAAQGMFVFFSEALGMPTPLLVLCFSFIELMVVTSAMRARRSQIDTGSAGVDGIAMWVLTIMSGVLAATHAEDAGTMLLRLMAPLIAAWGWERSMKLERRQLTGHTGGLNWRWSPQRLLVRWGIADPTDRSTAEIAVERRLADLARAADNVRLVRSTGGSTRRQRRTVIALHRAIDKAADDGLVLGEPDIRERLREHLEGRFSAYTLPDYTPRTDWSKPPAIDGAQISTARGEDVEAVDSRAIEAQLAEFEREFTDRAPIAEHAPIAREPIADRATDVARATADRAPIARGETDESIAIEDTSPIAIEATPAREEVIDAQAQTARADATDHRAPIAAHSPAELATDRAPIADRDDETASEIEESDSDVAGERRARVTLVRDVDRARAAIGSGDRSPRAGRAPIARDTAVDGSLARAADRAPIARGAGGTGPFARELSRAQATRLARAVIERGRSKQPIEVLASIYQAHSQGHAATHIGKVIVGLPHSTVGRAIAAADQVAGPRPLD
ncbi:hypothetical protein ACQPXH_33170 (plasmid) [Nocardia sp. CA-135953]|uniref:hypothetical protein n=1 Tax=Nocardia sp. CA-135953 TaxID=3239978 RepID=UPI003D986290